MSGKKLNLNFEGHMTTINSGSFQDIVAHASKQFAIPSRQLVLSYVDDEGDNVSIKSDMELQELFRMGGNEFDLSVRRQLDSSIVLPTNTEDDMLNTIRTQLKAINTSFENFAGSRTEHIKKIKQSNEYEEQLKTLKTFINKLEEENKALKTSNEEKDKIFQNKDVETNRLRAELHQNKEANQKLGYQLQIKMKELYEVRKEKESIALQHQFLQTKLDTLQKDFEHKNQENLQLSRVVSEVKAEREALQKTTHTLKQQLEFESQEKEKLQQSLFISARFPDVIPVNHDDPDPDNPKTTEREWESELSILENLGYKDRAANLKLLIKFQSMAQVVSHHKSVQSAALSEPGEPADPQYVDVLMLESMGFFDKEKNLAYLKKYGGVENAINQLLMERDNM